MTMLGGQELLIIFLIIVLLFGANKLPELARSMGKAKKEFKTGMKEEEEEEEKKEETPSKAKTGK
ncbi:MAG: twin-arginine translocase TatA/TatE family subunit [Candidatus Hydrothermarchaeota archaeon]|jgi:sec-independent protein translocase protein TatA|nr:twin-arginine translocase TatA/TatE family subunit [Candidatus Hydrothermarchaeota archaeon]